MVAFVGRAVCDNGKYQLQIKTDEVVFGGGRLGVSNVTVPLQREEVVHLFDKK
jgi:hypothetical protein